LMDVLIQLRPVSFCSCCRRRGGNRGAPLADLSMSLLQGIKMPIKVGVSCGVRASGWLGVLPRRPGPAGTVPMIPDRRSAAMVRLDVDEHVEEVVELLAAIAPVAADKHLVLCCETWRLWCAFE